MLCSPYEDSHDSILAQLCQVTLFCFIGASMYLNLYQDEATRAAMDVLLVSLNMLPIATALYLETPLPAKVNSGLSFCVGGVQSSALALRSSAGNVVSRSSRASRATRASRMSLREESSRMKDALQSCTAKLGGAAAALWKRPTRRGRQTGRFDPADEGDGPTAHDLGAVGRRGALKCTMPALSKLSQLSTTMAAQNMSREEELEQRRRERAMEVAQRLEQKRAQAILRGLVIGGAQGAAVEPPTAQRLPAPLRRACGVQDLGPGAPPSLTPSRLPGGKASRAARLAAIRARPPPNRSGGDECSSHMAVSASRGRRGSCLAERTMAASVERPGRERRHVNKPRRGAVTSELDAEESGLACCAEASASVSHVGIEGSRVRNEPGIRGCQLHGVQSAVAPEDGVVSGALPAAPLQPWQTSSRAETLASFEQQPSQSFVELEGAPQRLPRVQRLPAPVPMPAPSHSRTSAAQPLSSPRRLTRISCCESHGPWDSTRRSTAPHSPGLSPSSLMPSTRSTTSECASTICDDTMRHSYASDHMVAERVVGVEHRAFALPAEESSTRRPLDSALARSSAASALFGPSPSSRRLSLTRTSERASPSEVSERKSRCRRSASDPDGGYVTEGRPSVLTNVVERARERASRVSHRPSERDRIHI
jgi:hypothetical protein